MFEEIYGDGVHEDIPQPEDVLIQEENPHNQVGGGGIFAEPQLDRRNVVQSVNNISRYLFLTIMLINIFNHMTKYFEFNTVTLFFFFIMPIYTNPLNIDVKIKLFLNHTIF